MRIAGTWRISGLILQLAGDRFLRASTRAHNLLRLRNLSDCDGQNNYMYSPEKLGDISNVVHVGDYLDLPSVTVMDRTTEGWYRTIAHIYTHTYHMLS